jgi:quinol monooxygenase YgiN
MTMERLTVVARVVAEKNFVEALRIELLKLVAPTRQEEGCIDYTLHQDHLDPALFFFYETWASAAALEKHRNSPHFLRYVAAVGHMLKEKEVHLLTRIA